MGLASKNGSAKDSHPSNLMLPALVVGLVLGATMATLWVWLTPPSVAVEDYAVVVAAAYSRERLPLNAVERLASAGVRDPVSAVVSIAASFRRDHPERQRDADNLDQLAEAVRPQSTARAVTPPSTTSSGISSGWLTAIVLIVLAIVGGVVYKATRRRPPRESAWRTLPEVDEPQLQQAELVGGMRSDLPPARAELDDDGDLPLGRQTRAPGGRMSPGGRAGTAIGRRREVVLRPFVCTYHGGDEPFEDVHPIAHEDGDVLVGACGLTAAAKLDPASPARYYAFSAWVHDYLSGEPMRATGILSPWASGRKAISLYDPVLTQATVHRAEKGLSATMETANLVIMVEVTDVSYGIARDVPANSYFTILAVKFAVKVKSQP